MFVQLDSYSHRQLYCYAISAGKRMRCEKSPGRHCGSHPHHCRHAPRPATSGSGERSTQSAPPAFNPTDEQREVSRLQFHQRCGHPSEFLGRHHHHHGFPHHGKHGHHGHHDGFPHHGGHGHHGHHRHGHHGGHGGHGRHGHGHGQCSEGNCFVICG